MYEERKIKDALVKAGEGLSKYLEIMELLNMVDVSKDRSFQRKFNHFYRMRSRPAEFYNRYYRLLETHKNTGISFQDALKSIYNDLGRVEASFCSKLVATVNPGKPVWDKYILEHLKLKAPSYGTKNRMEKTVEIYESIESWYSLFLQTDDAKGMIQLFDETYEDAKVTDLKKIDLTLWQMRD